MTVEEAMKLLNQLVAPHSEHLDALRAAKKALEKQIPKQIIMNNSLICYCPECDGIVNSEDIFCRWCGQKFDDGCMYIKNYDPNRSDEQ